MKKLFIPLFVATVLAFMSLAGSAQESSPQAPAAQTSLSSEIAAGTIIQAELSKSLDARKAKPGDKVQAKVSMDLLAHGQIVLPRETKIVGHVVQAKAHSKQSPDSRVVLVFDTILLKGGRKMALPLSVQALGRPLLSFPQAGDDMVNAASAGVPPGLSPSGAGPGTMGQTGPIGQSGGMSGAARIGADPTRSPLPPDGDPAPHPGEIGSQGSVSPLAPTSQGVVGIKDLSLTNSPEGSAVNSDTRNVHLDGGAQLILRVQ
jgi:hypothetical protein